MEDDFRAYLKRLEKTKPVIVTGDMNVAHREIDLKNPKTNRKNAGFTDEERERFSQLLAAGFIDSYRSLYPEKIEYSWWSYRFNAEKTMTGMATLTIFWSATGSAGRFRTPKFTLR